MATDLYTTAWWRKNGRRWFEDFEGGRGYDAQEAAVQAALAGIDADSILEVGCGTGRITRYLAQALPRADLMATDVMRGALHFDLDAPTAPCPSPPCDTGTEMEPRDLVVAAEVLMHRPPDRIADDVELLCRMATRYVLTADWHEQSDRYAAGCYQHDYPALFGRYGIVTETPVPEARQSVFLTRITTKEAADGPHS